LEELFAGSASCHTVDVPFLSVESKLSDNGPVSFHLASGHSPTRQNCHGACNPFPMYHSQEARFFIASVSHQPASYMHSVPIMPNRHGRHCDASTLATNFELGGLYWVLPKTDINHRQPHRVQRPSASAFNHTARHFAMDERRLYVCGSPISESMCFIIA